MSQLTNVIVFAVQNLDLNLCWLFGLLVCGLWKKWNLLCSSMIIVTTVVIHCRSSSIPSIYTEEPMGPVDVVDNTISGRLVYTLFTVDSVAYVCSSYS